MRSKEEARAYMKARRERLKAARRCTICAAGMPEGDDRTRCVECRAIAHRSSVRWTRNNRQRQREINQRSRDRNREQRNADNRERYMLLKVEGVCVQCHSAAASEDAVRCSACQAIEKSYAKLRWLARRGRGRERRDALRRLASRKRAYLRRLREPRGSLLLDKVHDVRVAAPARVMPRDRLLAAMRRMDWSSSSEVADALEIGTNKKDRGRVQQMLKRLFREGLLERRSAGRLMPDCGVQFEYRVKQ